MEEGGAAPGSSECRDGCGLSAMRRQGVPIPWQAGTFHLCVWPTACVQGTPHSPAGCLHITVSRCSEGMH